MGTIPNVRQAVRWNSPFYGIEGQVWFLTFHCFTKYKVAFLNGASLQPLPPVGSKDQKTRCLHIHEDDQSWRMALKLGRALQSSSTRENKPDKRFDWDVDCGLPPAASRPSSRTLASSDGEKS